MQRDIALFVGILIILVTAAMIFSTADDEVVEAIEPQLVVSEFQTDNLSAQSYVVFDPAEPSQLLSSQNENAVLPIASVTKLFSAAMVMENGQLEETTTITQADVATEGRAGKLKQAEVYSQRDLLWPLLLESSNDAAAALERVNSDLISSMNEYAEESGAAKTSFADASGLSDGNVSTAADLSKLASQLYFNRPHVFDITRLEQHIGEQTGWVNNNPFINDPGYRGGKHGYTEAANRTVVAFFEETLSSGQDYLVGYVVLGSDDLKADVDLLRQQVKAHVSFQ